MTGSGQSIIGEVLLAHNTDLVLIVQQQVFYYPRL